MKGITSFLVLIIILSVSVALKSEKESTRKVNKLNYVNITVSKHGFRTVRTIGEAIQKAPENSLSPFIIFIEAGIYVEDNLIVNKTKINLWFVGEGRGRTIISGSKSVGPHINTMTSATLTIWGNGSLLQDMTIANDAGPVNHQAVALLIGADKAIVYHCEIKGYQDTLYAYIGRQFYRECDIYGTIDFIFGDAASVFQNCTIWARKPMARQTNVVTAQGRPSNEGRLSGISIHGCQLRATPELDVVKSSFKTYLGRPWKNFATVVYLQSYMGDHIAAEGWLEWSSASPLADLYYGEFENNGPGANNSLRVKWLSVHPNMTINEAKKLTVAEFIQGQRWIPATGVPYQEGLY